MEFRIDGTCQQRARAAGRMTLLSAMALLAIVAISAYLVIRVDLLHRADYKGLEAPITFALLLAECFILLHALGYVLSVIRVLRHKPAFPAAILRSEEYPLVDILVAARHEPREILERTLTALAGMNYPNKRVWFLDDSSEARYQNEAEHLCREFGVQLFRRQTRHGAKAGIINDCLQQLEGKYVAVFDADQCPMPFFLNRIVPLLEANDKLAFVQTPQFYSNIDRSRVARAAGSQQAVFYEYICEAKAASGTAFCCGTNVVFRRSALLSVGALDENSVTEDFATSVKLHVAGWRSLYYGEAYTMGLGPESLPAYFRQQYRWARGTLGVGVHLLKQLLTRPTSLSFWQWVDYGLSGTFYLIGWAYLILMLCPMLYILFSVPSYFARPEIYLAAFMPYLVFAFLAFVGGLRRRHYRISQLVMGQILGMVAAPVHVLASIAAILNLKSTFGITSKKQTTQQPLRTIWPQLSIWILNYVVFIWGCCRFVYEHDAASGINAFWVGVHFCVYWNIFYFHEAPQPKPTITKQVIPQAMEVTSA